MAQPQPQHHQTVGPETELLLLTATARGQLTYSFDELRILSGGEPEADCNADFQLQNPDSAISPFCLNCGSIDIAAMFERNIESHIYLGLLRDIVGRIGCEFCQYIRRVMENFYSISDLPRFIEFTEKETCESARFKCVLRNFPITTTRKRFHVLIVTKPHMYPPIPSHVPRLQELGRNSEDLQNSLKGRDVPPLVDSSTLRRWLWTCERRHPSVPVNNKHLRLIDLEGGCLRQVPDSCRYITLSYVWGCDQAFCLRNDNYELLQNLGSLASDNQTIPKTIRDAMILTRKLGERFLWVDSLCIIQDDQEDIARQIGSMDEVYLNSTLTIVANHGTSAQAGLPGIGQLPRSQAQVKLDTEWLKLTTLLPLRSTKDNIAQTSWGTRAWTHQEELLSSRLLFLMTDQVTFECKGNCHFYEEMTEGPSFFTSVATEASSKELSSTSTPFFPLSVIKESSSSFDAYAELVSEYTTRKLTNPLDIINAVWGTLKRLMIVFQYTPICNGIPIAAIDSALLWQPVGLCVRRRDRETGRYIYPSWSWAGWEGAINYNEFAGLQETLESTIKWETDAARLQQQRARRRSGVPEFKPEDWERTVVERKRPQPRSLRIDYKHITGDPKIRFDKPINVDECLRIFSGINPRDCYLRFFSKSALFSITGKHTKLHVGVCTETSRVHNTCPLSVFDANGNIAGTVLIDTTVAPGLYNESQEFIALSRTTIYSAPFDLAWDSKALVFQKHLSEDPSERTAKLAEFRERTTTMEKNELLAWFDHHKFEREMAWPLYNVLLVFREKGVVYRRGLGKIHVDAFDPAARDGHFVLG